MSGATEHAALMPLPPAFDGLVEHGKRVSPTCLISFERHRYSMPASFADSPVNLRVHPDRLVVAAEGRILRQHLRVIQRSPHLPPRTVDTTVWPSFSASRGRSGTMRPPRNSPPAFRQLQDLMVRKPGDDREMVDIPGAGRAP